MRSADRTRMLGTTLVALGSVTLIRLPTFLGDSTSPLYWLLSLAPFWLATVLLSWPPGASLDRLRHRLMGKEWLAVSAVAFLVLTFISFIRSALVGAISFSEAAGHLLLWLTVLGFGASLALAQDEARSNVKGYLFPLAALGAYVGVNLLLFAVGLRGDPAAYGGQIGSQSLMLRMIGIETVRKLFPMAVGVNAFGGVAGAGAAGGGILLLSRNTVAQRWVGGVLLIMGLIAILMTDSRGGLIAAVLATGLVILTPRARLPRWRWVALASPVLPLLALVTLSGVSELPAARALARRPDSLITANNRVAKWQAVMEFLRAPQPIHAIGYGYEGHQISGVSSGYIDSVARPVNPEAAGPHNVLLQIVIDTGYLGLLAFLAVLYYSLKGLGEAAAAQKSGALPALGVMIYLVILGTVERVPTVYGQALFALFLFLVILALFAPD